MDNQVDVIGDIKSKVRLSSYVKLHADGPLKKAPGNTYRTKCFIHGGDNPNSLSVNDEMGFYKCFACGTSGDIFTMYQKIEGSDFPESLEYFAGIAGVTLPKNDYTIGKSRLYEVNDVIAAECHEFLMKSKDEDAIEARKYLKSRGMTKKMMKKWYIGFMPEGDYSTDLILDSTNDTKALLEVGILRGKGRNVWTPYRGRIMFPIMDSEDRVLGFTSRQINDEIDGEKHYIECYKEEAKYINSPESSIYQKSKVLYGEHLLGPVKRNDKVDTDLLVTVEGPMDAIGINEVLDNDSGQFAVSVCGTALTTGHLPQLRRSKRIISMFDGDSAGHKAAVRSFWMVSHLHDTRLDALILEDDLDPWDMTQDDPDKTFDMINNAAPFISSVVFAQWQIYGQSRTEMIDWVRDQYPSIGVNRNREALISYSAKIMGMSKTVLKGDLSLPVILDDHRFENTNNEKDDDSSSEDIEIQKHLSLQTSSTVSMLLSLPYEKRVSVLASLEVWSDTIQDALHSWGTIYNAEDILAYEKLIFGVDANIPRNIDQEVASLQVDSTKQCQNIQTVLSGMAQQILTGIDSMINQGGYPIKIIGEHAMNIRNMLNKNYHRNVKTQSYILSYLLDVAIDIERISNQNSSSSYAVG